MHSALDRKSDALLGSIALSAAMTVEAVEVLVACEAPRAGLGHGGSVCRHMCCEAGVTCVVADSGRAAAAHSSDDDVATSLPMSTQATRWNNKQKATIKQHTASSKKQASSKKREARSYKHKQKAGNGKRGR